MNQLLKETVNTNELGEINFEYNKKENKKIRIKFEAKEIIEQLFKEINKLKKDIELIKKSKINLTTQDILIREWDNEYDEIWNRL